MDRAWDRLIPESEMAVFRAAGYGRRGEWGRRPALLVVDVNYNFIGDRPEPILESIKRWRNSCGEIGWQAIPRIAELLQAARHAVVPVFYSTQGYRPTRLSAGSWAQKNARVLTDSEERQQMGAEIVKEIAPLPDEVVIRKNKPSAFFGSPLVSHLVGLGIDTVVIAGTTTSGCVRATAVDAFSYDYRVVVVEDCVFDRSPTSHAITLFDLQAKYADVVPRAEVIPYFESLGG
ncbi:MAG: isochorismatase family protein [Candidatus Rokubacteria bacterium]|nr:isochorismatase family protein [Candidatus Rokubacteria bacterium]